MNKTSQDLKVVIESIKKIKSEGNMEMKNSSRNHRGKLHQWMGRNAKENLRH